MSGRGPGPMWLSRRDEVVAMLAAGEGTAAIAARYGCNRGTVRTALNRLGLKIPQESVAVERRALMNARWQTPGYREAMSEVGRKGGSVSYRKVLDCVPMPYRAEYFRLVKSGMAAEEARAMFKAEWPKLIRRALLQIAAVAKPLAAEQRRHHNSLEGQIERIRSGQARVVPSLRMSRPVSNDRSLTGNATGMCA